MWENTISSTMRIQNHDFLTSPTSELQTVINIELPGQVVSISLSYS